MSSTQFFILYCHMITMLSAVAKKPYTDMELGQCQEPAEWKKTLRGQCSKKDQCPMRYYCDSMTNWCRACTRNDGNGTRNGHKLDNCVDPVPYANLEIYGFRRIGCPELTSLYEDVAIRCNVDQSAKYAPLDTTCKITWSDEGVNWICCAWNTTSKKSYWALHYETDLINIKIETPAPPLQSAKATGGVGTLVTIIVVVVIFILIFVSLVVICRYKNNTVKHFFEKNGVVRRAVEHKEYVEQPQHAAEIAETPHSTNMANTFETASTLVENSAEDAPLFSFSEQQTVSNQRQPTVHSDSCSENRESLRDDSDTYSAATYDGYTEQTTLVKTISESEIQLRQTDDIISQSSQHDGNMLAQSRTSLTSMEPFNLSTEDQPHSHTSEESHNTSGYGSTNVDSAFISVVTPTADNNTQQNLILSQQTHNVEPAWL